MKPKIKAGNPTIKNDTRNQKDEPNSSSSSKDNNGDSQKRKYIMNQNTMSCDLTSDNIYRDTIRFCLLNFNKWLLNPILISVSRYVDLNFYSFCGSYSKLTKLIKFVCLNEA